MRTIVTVLALLAMVTVSQAAVTLDIQNMGAPTSSFAAGLEDYSCWLLTLNADDASEISSLDFDKNIGKGFSGPLHQVWQVTDDGFGTITKTPTPNRTDADVSVPYGMDSHMLIALTTLDPIVVNPITEDSSGTGSPVTLPSTLEAGMGTFLSGTVALPSNTATSVPLAWLVIPNGQSVDYSFSVGGAQAGQSQQFAGSIVVPEPATMGLLAIGGIAALIRRRR
jgi:hypothetical protein